MKKKVFITFLLLLVLSISIISAANETVEDRAYSCLEGRVKDKCSAMSSEEKVFSLLAIGECKDSVITDSKYKTNTKFTAQTILALSNMKIKTDDTEAWLLSQNKTPDNMEWLLQVESIGDTKCTITYSGSSYTINIGANKKIDSGAGTCLSLYAGNYWLKIADSCYDREFEVTCDKSFSTNLLYKKTTSDVLYVSANTHSASAEGFTMEKVNSFCFAQGSACDYEASLWSALVLSFKGYDISSFIPYLITMMDEDVNKKFLPESFLYSLTNDYRNELLLKQSSQGYWKVADDQYYDTALALLPFQNEDINEKSITKTWLEGVQGSDGCWSNLRDTAFLLYSIWPRPVSSSPDTDDCESSHFFCMSSISCLDAGGDVLSGYGGCYGTSICCSKDKELESCEEQNGELCSSGEDCLGGKDVEASDSTSSKICCVDGTCGVQENPECELRGGFCKTSCGTSEELASYSCSSYDVCCVAKKKSNWLVIWIIILSILILLVVLGIVYRNKLVSLYHKVKIKIKSGKGKQPSGAMTPGGPRFPPSSSSNLYPGAIPRRIIPQSAMQRRPMIPSTITPAKPAAKTRRTTTRKSPALKTTTVKTVTTKTTGKTPAVKKTTTTTTKKAEGNELEDVLKKLRELGK